MKKSSNIGVKRVEGVTAKIMRVENAKIEDFISCDAVAFGSSNYFGYMSGLMKDFFDRAWNVRDKIYGKPAVAFTSGGGPSNSALLSIERMFDAFRMVKVCDGVALSGIPTARDLEACRKLGETLAKAAMKRP
ncbi:flavodoxin family protein [Candidatus Bathyarchaeota archaeon]|nr:flavodoxin family protein [Candidatus Bathyarchaeota archaeon]